MINNLLALAQRPQTSLALAQRPQTSPMAPTGQAPAATKTGFGDMPTSGAAKSSLFGSAMPLASHAPPAANPFPGSASIWGSPQQQPAQAGFGGFDMNAVMAKLAASRAGASPLYAPAQPGAAKVQQPAPWTSPIAPMPAPALQGPMPAPSYSPPPAAPAPMAVPPGWAQPAATASADYYAPGSVPPGWVR